MDSDQRFEVKHSRTSYLRRALWSSDVQLSKDEAASTFFRFFRSKHVDDFRFIAKAATICFMLFCASVIIVQLFSVVIPYLTSFFFTVTSKGSGATPDILKVTLVSEPTPLLDAMKVAIAYIGSAIPIFGAIIAWTYLSASARLGIVDLFACEIATLCRVGTLFDVGQRYVDMIKKNPAAPAGIAGPDRTAGPARTASPGRTASSGRAAHPDRAAGFDSKEDYFPVFSSNSGDLKLLEVLVVTNITAFYTYMKAARDLLRRLSELGTAAKGETEDPESLQTSQAIWNAIVHDLIYVVFLGYERARKAVGDLIEFQPVRDENTIVILVTELKCYAFLRKHFADGGVRLARLKLRERGYLRDVPVLYYRVMSHKEDDEDWREAMSTVSELESCYDAVLNEDLRLAALRAEGEELRTECESITSPRELDDWRKRTRQWSHRVVARFKELGAACTENLATWDAVLSPPISTGAPADFATGRMKACDEHVNRLAKLGEILSRMRADASMPKTG